MFLALMEGAIPSTTKTWISPSGEIHPVRADEMHEVWARKHLGLPSEVPQGPWGDAGLPPEGSDTLFSKGWARTVPYGSNVLVQTKFSPITSRAKISVIDMAMFFEKQGVVTDSGGGMRFLWTKENA